MKRQSPQRQLAGFISRYTPEIARLGTAVIRKMRVLVPGATELVYDNYNALVVGFGPGERTSEAVFSVALYPRWVNLFFLQGSTLPDPNGLLRGTGKVVRSIKLTNVRDLDDLKVRGLIKTALAHASPPIDPSASRRLVIKSVSARQRARRPN